MNRLKNMTESLIGCVQAQMADLKNADTVELGQAVDMIKDLEEAMYYCSIIKAMEAKEEEEKYTRNIERYYYTPMYDDYYRDMDYEHGRMYYTQPRDSQGRFTERRSYYGGNGSGNGSSSSSGSSNSGGGSRYYTEREMPMSAYDSRHGKSGQSRKMYMESKEMHMDKATKMHDLENYLKELGEDLVDMIDGASPEEQQLLQKKLSSLTQKIGAINA